MDKKIVKHGIQIVQIVKQGGYSGNKGGDGLSHSYKTLLFIAKLFSS